MSQLFDPLYPSLVNYRVSQSIWELYEIHFWQLLFPKWGKNKVFYSLQRRYESQHYEGTALLFLVLVFVVCYLIQCLPALREQNQMNGRQNDTGVHNQNRPIDANANNDQNADNRQEIQ